MTRIYFALTALVAALLAPSPASAAGAQAANDLSALAGRWQINLEKTHMGRFGPNGQNMTRRAGYSFVFTLVGKNLRQDIYNAYPQPKPDRTMSVIADAKPHLCDDPVSCLSTSGSAKEQTFVYVQSDAHLLTRTFFIKDRIDEYSTYAVSSDGKTFTVTTWSPATPYWQNVQVFDKQP